MEGKYNQHISKSCLISVSQYKFTHMIDRKGTFQSNLHDRTFCVCRQTKEIKKKDKEIEGVTKAEEKLKDKCDHYRERAAELQDTVEKLTVS